MIWHNSTVAQIAEEFQTDIASGLSSSEAKNRLVEYGNNELNYKNSANLVKYLVSSINKITFISIIVVAFVNLILAFAVNSSYIVSSIVIILVAVGGGI